MSVRGKRHIMHNILKKIQALIDQMIQEEPESHLVFSCMTCLMLSHNEGGGDFTPFGYPT